MFGLGITEIVVILIVALLVFGPKRLPEVARSLGKSMGELRRTLDDIKHDVSEIQSAPPLTPAEAALEGTCEEQKATTAELESSPETTQPETDSPSAKETSSEDSKEPKASE